VRHQLRGWTLEQKRHVSWWMIMMLQLKKQTDIRRIGETAIPRDARTNTACDYCRRQR